MTRKNGLLLAVGVVLVAGALLLINRDTVQGQGGKGGAGGGGARYTVVETQGNNLLVTDNATNMIYYYYAIDKDEKIGADLKLRASVDLTQVGKDVIKIKPNK
jgi:hypothetical protein